MVATVEVREVEKAEAMVEAMAEAMVAVVKEKAMVVVEKEEERVEEVSD